MSWITFDQVPLDADPPEPGDLLSKTRDIFRVEQVVPVDSPVWPNRWKVELTNLGRRDQFDWSSVEAGTVHWPTIAKEPGERPQDLYPELEADR